MEREGLARWSLGLQIKWPSISDATQCDQSPWGACHRHPTPWPGQASHSPHPTIQSQATFGCGPGPTELLSSALLPGANGLQVQRPREWNMGRGQHLWAVRKWPSPFPNPATAVRVVVAWCRELEVTRAAACALHCPHLRHQQRVGHATPLPRDVGG